ncbi:MAG: Segregation and condensation protein B [Parcubacteria group bacterium GW2011_GWA2_36_10]|nr:MAG: Segregation and condensation protein B [Parcubacteria group bacterium GW2011_GWA2_36_10]
MKCMSQENEKKFSISLAALESLLLAAGKPLAFKEIADLFKEDLAKVEEILNEVEKKYNQPDSGIHLVLNNKKAQLVTNPNNAEILQAYLHDEQSGELSKASLETLTIIAYRQPISKEELEQIRGVNCSLIIRNLMIRGLVEAQDEKNDLAPKYSVTIDLLRHLGLDSVKQLPDFESLNSNENLQTLLEQVKPE